MAVLGAKENSSSLENIYSLFMITGHPFLQQLNFLSRSHDIHF